MPEYKLYRLDGAGQIASAPEYFDALDDDAALAVAQQRRGTGSAELWQGGRLVQRLRG
ncbi:hypothetical protein G7077_03850 [Sphingomonas piscis]|uniref:Uncharacterized protein n=1 Tax=Sphingomonas piscis TaxID=2714943 RepID=A0A6G7YN53_9SPHN|nr:hypothetical protein [Sphingomonas piscis]QIK78173.1 hypothetical protein G7077_03850 [Sphingomonas piscis]